MIIVDNKFNIKQVVYLKTDKEQQPRIVFAFVVDNYGLLYKLCCGASTSEHYDFEISETENVLGKTL